MVCTFSVIMEFSPPMIPAMPTAFSASLIMRMSLSTVRILAVQSLELLAVLAARLHDDLMTGDGVQSHKACMGWPYSSIT